MKEKVTQHVSKLWTRSYVFLLLANIFIYLAFYMIVATIAGHTKDIGGTSLEASLAISIFSITSLVFRLVSGNAVDTLGKKPVALAGVLIMVISTLSYVWMPVAGLLIMRVLQGVGWGMTSAAIAAAFSDMVPSDRRGEGIGYYSLTMIVSMSMAPLVAIMIMNSTGFNIIIATSIALLVIGTPFLKTSKIPETLSKAHGLKGKKIIEWNNLFEKRALLPSFLCFILVITLCAIMSYIYLFGKEIKMTNIWIYFIGHVSMVLITRPFIGRIFDKRGHVVVIIPGAISMLLGLFILSFANSTALLVIASLLYGLGYGATQPSLMAWAVNRSPAERRGAANGTFLCSMDLSFTIGPLILSYIADRSSYAVMYRLSTIFMVIFLVIYIVSVIGINIKKASVMEAGKQINI